MDVVSARNVIVVEDNRETRQWICETLRHHFDRANPLPAANCEEAEAILADAEAHGHKIDLALVDINLPDGSGIAIIQRIARSFPETLPVVVTIFEDDATLFNALAAGARGYVLKGVKTESLVEQIRRIEHGEPPISPQIAHRILAYFRGKLPHVPVQDAADSTDRLTQREMEILRLLGKGLTAMDISVALGISRNTCTTHIKAIYRKLGISTRAEAALEANRRGLV
ncbi:response regulator [Metarhizobium album]|nr:response regulator transcription factor [Rhizobium album]